MWQPYGSSTQEGEIREAGMAGRDQRRISLVGRALDCCYWALPGWVSLLRS